MPPCPKPSLEIESRTTPPVLGLKIPSAVPADDMIAEVIRDLFGGVNTPPKRVPTALAFAAFPPPAQVF
ncbi:hypothetical protein O1611_g9767 [Lasiodiplodia mahajangana]|uniref:Uncharacterized protein n=1 Tax=Lasiodiplodia mahajangana TaxID=1108764 RepID=A0ACC2J5Y6_9PEZI|nr:hypothetical protein O1611_g9767 [Lasiodiplodia mahajangana]